jgi:hypothetical protein
VYLTCVDYRNDVPVITIRSQLIPHLLKYSTTKNIKDALDNKNLDHFGFIFNHGTDPKEKSGWDFKYPSHNIHQALADFLILYIEKELCELKVRQTQPDWSSHKVDERIWPAVGPEVGDLVKVRSLP